ncbi:MAG: TorF family putative porin [Campylobacterota bacterium]|nr:TorF family putative porin [Campylobacterota bacterium]
MKLIKLSLAAALAVTVAHAEMSDVGVSANMALTSNYVWRGMTQTSNAPAIQGGVDLDYNGLYLGVWGSNIDFASSLELDVYAGYAGEISGFGYDVGICQYMYPNDTEANNFAEAYLGLSYDFTGFGVGAKYYMGIETNEIDPTDAWEVSASAELPAGFGVEATYGDYDEVTPYYLVALTKSYGKFDFSVAYTDATDLDDSDNIVATVGTSF